MTDYDNMTDAELAVEAYRVLEEAELEELARAAPAVPMDEARKRHALHDAAADYRPDAAPPADTGQGAVLDEAADVLDAAADSLVARILKRLPAVDELEDIPGPELGKRTDGLGLLYAGQWNSIYGAPGCGKSWCALWVALEQADAGARVAFVDWEDSLQGLAGRVRLLRPGGYEALRSSGLRYVSGSELDYGPADGPALTDDEQNASGLLAANLAKWLAGDAEQGRPAGLLVIDTAGAAGAGADEGDTEVREWITRRVLPFTAAGVTVLSLDHKPKRDIASKYGAIGSQRKRAAIRGAEYEAKGDPAVWNATTDGRIELVLRKDARGGAPAVQGKTAARLVGSYREYSGERVFEAELRPPTKDESDGKRAGEAERTLRHEVLSYITDAGAGGVSSRKAVVDGLGKNNAAVREAIGYLLKAGEIEEVGRFGLRAVQAPADTESQPAEGLL